MKDDGSKRYWFPAKKYGWGWGAPSTWQGWLTVIIFLISVTPLHLVVSPESNMNLYLLSIFGLTTALLIICYLKGEPPGWRWGDKNQKK